MKPLSRTSQKKNIGKFFEDRTGLQSLPLQPAGYWTHGHALRRRSPEIDVIGESGRRGESAATSRADLDATVPPGYCLRRNSL